MEEAKPGAALLVPPMRLGRKLREQRQETGVTLRELAASGDESTALPVSLLEDVESGRAALDESTLALVSALYGLSVGELAPQRSELIIDLEEGVLSIGDEHVKTIGDETDEVLTRYLALVYSLRDLPSGSQVPLRNLDVGVLAHALAAERAVVADRLGAMMTQQPEELESVRSSLRRKLVVPVAGILVGVTALGGLVLVQSDPTPSVSDEIPVDIGDAVMISEPGAPQIPR